MKNENVERWNGGTQAGGMGWWVAEVGEEVNRERELRIMRERERGRERERERDRDRDTERER